MEAALDNQYADELRRAKTAGSDSPLIKGGEGGLEGGEPRSFRERVMAARQALDLKERAKKKIEEKITAPAKQGTSWLLKASWLNLIDSLGLTLIYINLHVFGRWVLGDKFFCKLGEEWAPREASAAGGEAGKTAGKAVGIVEIMALLILDLIVIFVILGALSLIVMIINFWDMGFWDKALAIWNTIGTLGWGAVQALIDLFNF